MRIPAVGRNRATRRRVVGAFAGALLAAAGVLLVGTSPAAAHAELISSVPAEGATVQAPPAAITLTFGEDIAPESVTVVASSPAGQLALGAPKVTGGIVTSAFPQDASGEVTVSYRVVSADGHPVRGSVNFSVEAPAPLPSAETPSASPPGPTETATTTPVPSQIASTAPEPTPSTPSSAVGTATDEPVAPTDVPTSPAAGQVPAESDHTGHFILAGVSVLLVLGIVIASVRASRSARSSTAS